MEGEVLRRPFSKPLGQNTVPINDRAFNTVQTIEQFELANSLDNLVTLCNTCQKKLED